MKKYKNELRELTLIFWKTFYNQLQSFKNSEYIYIWLSGWNSLIEFYKIIWYNFEKIEKQIRDKFIFFYLDERKVSFNSFDSNYFLTLNIFLQDLIDKKLIDKNQILIPKFDWSYWLKIKSLDFSFFWVWEDWHIASIFPNHTESWIEQLGFIDIKNSPKLPKERISISKTLIHHIKFPYLFFIWNNKNLIYNSFLNETNEINLPAVLLKKNNKLIVFKSNP